MGSFEFSNSYWPRGFVEYYKAAVLALHRGMHSVCVCVCVCVSVCTCLHVCMHMCMCVCVPYVHVYTYVHMCVCMLHNIIFFIYTSALICTCELQQYYPQFSTPLTPPPDPLRDPPFVVITDKTLALELGLSHAPSITAVSYHRGNQLYTSSMFSEGISNWSRSITEEQVCQSMPLSVAPPTNQCFLFTGLCRVF